MCSTGAATSSKKSQMEEKTKVEALPVSSDSDSDSSASSSDNAVKNNSSSLRFDDDGDERQSTTSFLSLSVLLLYSSGAFIWPLSIILPLALTWKSSYLQIFPTAWFEELANGAYPSPLGLSLGLAAVGIGQVLAVVYHFLRVRGYLGPRVPIQSTGAPNYNFYEGAFAHFAQPEGFVLIGGYLCASWMFGLMPDSYYKFEGGIEWFKVFQCLVYQDAIQYVMHYLEHVIHPSFYKYSHKQHHRFINPRLFDAFHGSVVDTTCMILIPFLITAQLVHCNVWSYMVFGSWYSVWLVLLHSEFYHVWDPFFRALALGTPGDHHVHHKMFNYNYGHLFMWCDKLFGTHRDVHGMDKKGRKGWNGVFNDHSVQSSSEALRADANGMNFIGSSSSSGKVNKKSE